jgi:protein-disulfide isomerase
VRHTSRLTVYVRGDFAEMHRMKKLAILLMASGVFGQSARAQDANRLLEHAASSRVKGQQGAPVMIYEIADFQCPFCGRFAREVYPRLDSAYVKTGKVQWFFVNLPLPNHGNAWVAAEAAICAGAVSDKFWAMHDRLFATQSEWASARDVGALLFKMAKDAGVNADSYEQCVNEDRPAALILQDVLFAASARVTGTPAFIINGEQLVMGVKSFEEWKDIIEKALLKTPAK